MLLLHRTLDEVERPVGVALASDDHQVRRSLLESAPGLLEPVDDPDHLDTAAVRKHRLDRLAVDSDVDGD